MIGNDRCLKYYFSCIKSPFWLINCKSSRLLIIRYGVSVKIDILDSNTYLFTRRQKRRRCPTCLHCVVRNQHLRRRESLSARKWHIMLENRRPLWQLLFKRRKLRDSGTCQILWRWTSNLSRCCTHHWWILWDLFAPHLLSISCRLIIDTLMIAGFTFDIALVVTNSTDIHVCSSRRPNP